MKSANSARFPIEPQPDLRLWRNAPRDVAVLVPAYRPSGALEALIVRLADCGVPAILLVDDGSPDVDRAAFERLALHPRVHLLRHAENRGKGMALKTGIRYFLDYLPHYKGLVTADGHHAAEDVLCLARALHKSPRLAILGARSFRTTPEFGAVPLRSRVGNRLTAALFRVVTSVSLTDVQTGLRALPAALLPGLLDLPGKRYEYEMSVLLHIARTRHPLAEQPVRTVSGAGERVSHFRPITDSVRVLRALLDRRSYGTGRVERRSDVGFVADHNHSSSARTVRAK
jgi:glycosyltransferase involved in cell wall biosynthesis